MKQHIDTIPVWDAYKADTECPLCCIRSASEAAYVEEALGDSVMEPASRVEANRVGFCNRHLTRMFQAGNRLGLALLTDTRLIEVVGRVEEAARRAGQAQGRTLLGRPSASAATAAREGAKAARAAAQDCVICKKLDTAMARYVVTILYLWAREREFREIFTQSKGLCVAHYADLLERAPDEIPGDRLPEFISALNRVQLEGLERVERDLKWFTEKFDYRNRDKPWGDSEDAVERALLKLRGPVI